MSRTKTVSDRVARLLSVLPATAKQVAATTGEPLRYVRVTLSIQKKAGRVVSEVGPTGELVYALNFGGAS
jgi:hypothetical protein